jgi:hypothetical protein
MELNEKIKLLNILNELVRTGELDISSSRSEELLPGENIRTIYMKGDVINIYLSGTISVQRVK